MDAEVALVTKNKKRSEPIDVRNSRQVTAFLENSEAKAGGNPETSRV